MPESFKSKWSEAVKNAENEQLLTEENKTEEPETPSYLNNIENDLEDRMRLAADKARKDPDFIKRQAGAHSKLLRDKIAEVKKAAEIRDGQIQ